MRYVWIKARGMNGMIVIWGEHIVKGAIVLIMAQLALAAWFRNIDWIAPVAVYRYLRDPRRRARYKIQEELQTEAATVLKRIVNAAFDAGYKRPLKRDEKTPYQQITRGLARYEVLSVGVFRIDDVEWAAEIIHVPNGKPSDLKENPTFVENVVKVLGYPVDFETERMEFIRDGKKHTRTAFYLHGNMLGKAKNMPKPGAVKLADVLQYLTTTKADSMTICFGEGFNHEFETARFDRQAPFWLIAGLMGFGKTKLIDTIIATLARRNPPADLQMGIIDFKNNLVAWNDLPHMIAPLAIDLEAAAELLARFKAELKDRAEKIGSYRDIWKYNTTFPKARLPYILIIADELADLTSSLYKNEDKDTKAIRTLALRDLLEIARKGSGLGMFIVAATQRPSSDVITGSIKGLAGYRFAFRHATDRDSIVTIDMGLAASISKEDKGRVVFYPDMTIWQTPLVSDEDIAETIAQTRQSENLSLIPTEIERAICEWAWGKREWIPATYGENGKTRHVLQCTAPVSAVLEAFAGTFSGANLRAALKSLGRHAARGIRIGARRVGVIPLKPPVKGLHSSPVTFFLPRGKRGECVECRVSSVGFFPPHEVKEAPKVASLPAAPIAPIAQILDEWVGMCEYCAHHATDASKPCAFWGKNDAETGVCMYWEHARMMMTAREEAVDGA